MKRHSNRDKNMKGYVDHASVERRTPAPCVPTYRGVSKTRRHGGLWCVQKYAWYDELWIHLVSLPEALKDTRSGLAQMLPDKYGPQNYYGLPDGMTYEQAVALVKTLKDAERAKPTEKCHFCGKPFNSYRKKYDHLRYHRRSGHKPLVSV